MKKRLFALLFVICILLLSGCGTDNPATTAAAPQKTSFEIISEALEKTDALATKDMEMVVDIDMTVMGQNVKMPMTVRCKGKDLTSATPIMQTYIKMSVMGQENEIDMYQEGNWAYITTQGQSFKTDISEENPYDQLGSSQDIMMDLPEELLKDFPMTQNSDGSQTVTITIPNDTFESIYGDFLKSINSTSGAGTATSVSVKDATIKITVADGYLTVYDMSFGMTMNVSGVDASASVKASVKIIDPGQDVIITPPAGYQSYPVMG